LAELSNYDQPFPNRLERGGYIVEQPDGTFDAQPIQGSPLKFAPGPSGPDLDDWERGLAPWPGYMMSPDKVYRWERKGPFQTGLDNEDNFKLEKGTDACIAREGDRCMYRSMRCLAVTFFFASTLVVVPAMAQQTGPPAGVGPCGPLDDDERLSQLEHYAPLFTSADEDQADFRISLGVEQVSSGDPLEVAGHPAECGRVVAGAFRVLNGEILTGRPPATRANMEWAVLRIGPYWVIPMNPRPVEGATVQGYGQVLVFRVENLSFVDWFMG
jgi:hypothetical protein